MNVLKFKQVKLFKNRFCVSITIGQFVHYPHRTVFLQIKITILWKLVLSRGLIIWQEAVLSL